MITFLDPRSEPSAPATPYAATWVRPPTGQPIKIGLFANGFPDSVNFLEQLRLSLIDALPSGTEFVMRNKGNASAVATPQQVHELASQVHAVVAAYGH